MNSLSFLFLSLPVFIFGAGFKLFFGENGDDNCKFLVVDSDGDFTVGGDTTSWDASSKDILLAKFGQNGTMKYINSFGLTNDDTMNDLIILSDENYLFVGRAESLTQGTIVKIDSSDGSILWQYYVPISVNLFWESVQESESGRLYVFSTHMTWKEFSIHDVDSDGGYDGNSPNKFWMYSDDLANFAIRMLSLNSTNGLYLGYREDPGSYNDPIFGSFSYSYDREIHYSYYLGDSSVIEKTSSGILATSATSTQHLIILANDETNHCLVLYNVLLTDNEGSLVGGIRVCHSSHHLIGYDVVQTSDYHFLVVGKVVLDGGTEEQGLILKINSTCDGQLPTQQSVLFAQYFSDTLQLNAAKKGYEQGKILVVGVSSTSDCVVMKLEDDDGSVGCDGASSTAVDIISEIQTSERTGITSDIITDDQGGFTSGDGNELVSMTELATPDLGENKTCPIDVPEVWKCGGIPYTSDEVCNFKNGTCVSENVCNCSSTLTLYEGGNCERWRCNETLDNETSVCSSHGSCIKPDICECKEGFLNSYCDVTTCSGLYSNDTEIVCSGHGDCVDFGVCLCSSNYFGENCNVTTCQGILSNRSSLVCSSHAISCWPYEQCNCESNYFGSFCNVTQCGTFFSNDTSQVCSGHGSCESFNHCDCGGVGEYYGTVCQNFTCFDIMMNETSQVCGGGHGRCIELDTCDCDVNYTRYTQDCSIFECFSVLSNDTLSVCSSHGNCTGHDTCQCSYNYSLSDCSEWYCNETSKNDVDVVCSQGKGNCSRPDHCDCSSGYTGDFCELFSCFEVSSKDEGVVCAGHGICVQSNNCSCSNNYTFDEECSVFTCFGVFNNDTSTTICSGHGNCTSHDYCECRDNYTSNDCSQYSCFGVEVSSTSATTCSGYGECTAPDTCECDDPNLYIGENCEYFECYDIGVNVTEGCDENVDCVCSGHGICVGHNNCSCMELYPGYDCGSFACYGIVSTDLDHSCGFNDTTGNYGVCMDVDTCFCFPGQY